MNTISTDEDEAIKKIYNANDDYESTIHASQALVSLITWEKNQLIETAKYSFGRRMNTSDLNIHSPNVLITPDVTIQRNDELGYIVEVKNSLPNNQREWEKVVHQLQKYDDDLIGWWTLPEEKIINHSVILLIHQSRSKDFIDYYEDYLKKTNITSNKNISIFEFNRSDERTNYYFIRKEFGKIDDNKFDKRMTSGVQVPIEEVVSTYGKQKFTDCEPPSVEYTMSILWQNLFNSMPRSRSDPTQKDIPLNVNIGALTVELQKLHGSVGNSHRDVEFPRVTWISKAMNAFTEIGYAKKIDNENYTVIFKQFRLHSDLIEHFIRKRKKKATKSKMDAKQLELFPLSN